MKEKEEEKVFPKVHLNWYPRTYGKNKKTNRRRFKISRCCC